MSLFKRIFAKENPNVLMRPLYESVVAEGRRVGWFEQGQVPDTVDGRFDMIAAILSLVLIRLEGDQQSAQQSAWLMEHFVTDMDGQLRQIGVGDMVVGKHVKKIIGALGGRLGAYREALTGDGDLAVAVVRNIFREKPPADEAIQFVVSGLQNFFSLLEKSKVEPILEGNLPESVQ